LTVGKRTHLPARSEESTATELTTIERQRSKVELRFKNLKFHTLGKRSDGETNAMERVGRCRDDARSSIFGNDARSSMLEIDGLAVDLVVGGMRRERREKEKTEIA
jgi:hypothetical protein